MRAALLEFKANKDHAAAVVSLVSCFQGDDKESLVASLLAFAAEQTSDDRKAFLKVIAEALPNPSKRLKAVNAFIQDGIYEDLKIDVPQIKDILVQEILPSFSVAKDQINGL